MDGPDMPESQTSPKPYTYSRKRTAEVLDVHIDTVDNMVERGELERVQLTSRKCGITVRSIERLIGEAR
jgi:hypothetical protein